jgi:hypothetical protein
VVRDAERFERVCDPCFVALAAPSRRRAASPRPAPKAAAAGASRRGATQWQQQSAAAAAGGGPGVWQDPYVGADGDEGDGELDAQVHGRIPGTRTSEDWGSRRGGGGGYVAAGALPRQGGGGGPGGGGGDGGGGTAGPADDEDDEAAGRFVLGVVHADAPAAADEEVRPVPPRLATAHGPGCPREERVEPPEPSEKEAGNEVASWALPLWLPEWAGGASAL